ncbi:hypothetical protein SAMN04515668_1870 [Hymenobacter arizonensis]|uniref:Uncharacterized protein n=1 Tax=Hymenobacter arizonensis TaxID=1227077 RepID=A0A1I5XJ40_HYMAR|nr:hypothetical protein SAMN04515668_1870 [Hymenobacter arizonensis]
MLTNEVELFAYGPFGSTPLGRTFFFYSATSAPAFNKLKNLRTNPQNTMR